MILVKYVNSITYLIHYQTRHMSNSFENYPDITGDLYDEEYIWDYNYGIHKENINTDLRMIRYFKKVYNDINSGEIINYDQNKYLNVSVNINECITNSKVKDTIKEIINILKYYEKYYEEISNKLEKHVINTVNKKYIYKYSDGTIYIFTRPELERQSRWSMDIMDNHITISFENLRENMRRQFYYREVLLDDLHDKIKDIYSEMLKIEFVLHSYNGANRSISDSFGIILLELGVEYKKKYTQMIRISNEMSELKFCNILYNYTQTRRFRQWVPNNNYIA